jgi:PKD repeat protein
MRSLLGMLAAGLSVAAIGFPAAAQAATAPNDSFAGATVIASLPFSTTEDTSQATSDPSDPPGCSSNGSVWFSFTPQSDMHLQADTFGSNYDTELSAWTGTQDALNSVACNDDFSGSQSKITFAATAGTTYYFLVAQCCGSGGTGGGSLEFSLSQLAPPGNNDFANATPIGALPFSDTQDLTAATAEPAEPGSGCFASDATVWYSFTAGTTQSVSATTDQFGAGVAAYTGNSLGSLSQVGCIATPLFRAVTFRAQAGTTYYFQVGAWCCNGFGPVTFHLGVAADPVARFIYSPTDPSSFDTPQFIDLSDDPAGAGISSWAWDFGDGATSTLPGPAHHYAADGDYTVRLTVTTADGRTTSTSQVIQVRTHDVAITRLAVPKAAHVGQTIAINVYVQNTRYPETVEVNLAKGTPAGFTGVGLLTESVPVKLAGQTTRFAFTYTVTSDDQVTGKVTFVADAIIFGFRDALSADNSQASTPVKIG